MKFSNALSLVLAPVAVSARSSRQVKRDPQVGINGIGGVGGVGGVANVGVGVPVGAVGGVGIGGLGGLGGLGGIGLGAISGVNAVTVTQTVTVPAGAAATAILGNDGASTTIQPGASGSLFLPQEVAANVGDMIIFTFYGQNHTVTQSGFETPCDPLAGGMDSGYMPNPDNTIVPPPQVAMQVMTTDPLWMFCAQGNHCGRGMALSINPTAEKTHAQFQANAIAQRGGDLPGTAITGGTGPAPAAPAAAPAAPQPVDPAQSAAASAAAPGPINPASGTNGVVSPTAPVAVGNSATVGGGIVMGQGTIAADGSCQCAVQCAGGAFPDPATQGLNAFGGIAGTIDMNSAGVVAGAAAPVVAAPAAVSSVAAPAPVTPARR
ncbi:unnamed protein product [Parascedosporium putredinis]|uniref:Uncharacterized protein n=1 Tax=Parascedosporium putredinis TaxID=1442378 RepID=A0A9P1MD26_9PEZI|nr:unnamed protein product [Parascedosporium putredinis]CAI7999590.1 unnamed protein product [Parascedosporium putredinis]